MRTALLISFAVAAGSSCVSLGVESRARAAETVDVDPAPMPRSAPEDDFAVPFDRPAGMPAQGVAATLDQPPSMIEVPHADPDRVQLDLDERIAADQRLAEDVAEIDVDFRDGALVLDGVVTSQRAYDRVEEIARRVAPGSPVRNALVIRID